MNFRKETPVHGPGFQMAPMIDIIFLLLIFFIAAAVYSQWESKLEIKVPTSETAQHRARFPGEAIVNIDKDGQFYLNSINFTHERLEQVLSQLAKTYPDQPVVIRADKETHCRHLILLLDICAKSDIANISFATLSAEDVETEE
ncbi:MAG: biopolymer transporter ExbD [Victivallales bacterium]|nr:biopolymer transporter ExbD [Victivallales bacterium]